MCDLSWRCGVLEPALCYGLITFANKHLPTTVVAAFWPVQVPVAVILASCPVGIFENAGPSAGVAFCETLTKMQLIGVVLVLLGLTAVTQLADTMERKENRWTRMLVGSGTKQGPKAAPRMKTPVVKGRLFPKGAVAKGSFPKGAVAKGLWRQ